MSQTSKLVLGAAIVAVILLGAYYFWHATRTASPTASSQNAGEVTSLPSGAKSDDSSIEQDLSAIDSQLNGVKSDNQAASASVNASVSQ